jgi:hypothetical protein
MATETPEFKTSNRQTHGHWTMKKALLTMGHRAIDKRSSLGRAISAWKEELIMDLGGYTVISTQMMTVIDSCVKSKLMLDSIDTWLLTQPSLINLRKKALLPIVRERQALADSLIKNMLALGLTKRKTPALSLSQLLAASPETSQELVA